MRPTATVAFALLVLSPSVCGFTELRERFNDLDRWETSVSGNSLDVDVYHTGGGLELLVGPPPDIGASRRQDIRTRSSDFSWLNTDGQPVTYSFTICRFPPPTKDNFEAHLFLVGNSANPGSRAETSETNVIFFRMFDQGPGYGAELYYKVNSPRKSVYPPRLGGVGTEVTSISRGDSPIGTWGFTLEGTNVTLFGPSGLVKRSGLGAEVLTAFQYSTHVYVGITANAPSNVPDTVTISSVEVTAPVPLTIQKTPDNLVTISWPAFANNYILEVAEQWPKTEWSFAPPPIVQKGRPFSVAYPILSAPRFFQLIKNPLSD